MIMTIVIYPADRLEMLKGLNLKESSSNYHILQAFGDAKMLFSN